MTLAEKYARGIYEARRGAPLNDQAFYLSVELALKKRHHEKLLPQILQEYRKLASREDETRTVVRAATAEDEARALAKAKELGADDPLVKRDPSLIRGFTVQGPDFRFDASARKALLNLYARLTAY